MNAFMSDIDVGYGLGVKAGHQEERSLQGAEAGKTHLAPSAMTAAGKTLPVQSKVGDWVARPIVTGMSHSPCPRKRAVADKPAARLT